MSLVQGLSGPVFAQRPRQLSAATPSTTTHTQRVLPPSRRCSVASDAPPADNSSTVTEAARQDGSSGLGTATLPARGALPSLQRSASVLTSDRLTASTRASSDTAMQSFHKAAYQGVPGAYSEGAARKACPDMELLPCEQFEVAFQALSQWMAERAVLPIENSLGGSIHTVYDLLLRYRLHIVGEVSVEVNHCLLALPGTGKADLRRVASHPQALAQCDGYIRRLPNVVREAVDDTAGAAKMVAEQKLSDVAAIASRRAAELYGLDILEEGIQDMSDNVTRFLVLSRDPYVLTQDSGQVQHKTSIVFSLQAGPGQLFKALSVFALRDIDMTKIESRPMRSNPILAAPDASSPLSASAAAASNGGPQGGDPSTGTYTGRGFNYLFYVDFVGSLADQQAQNALRHLQEIAPFLRVLGSYPMDTGI